MINILILILLTHYYYLTNYKYPKNHNKLLLLFQDISLNHHLLIKCIKLLNFQLLITIHLINFFFV
jgi:hypothetical protein